MSLKQIVYVGVIGAGGVGKAFLSQLEGLTQRLSKVHSGPKLCLVFVARSNRLLITGDYTPIPYDRLYEKLERSSQPPLSIAEMTEYMAAAPGTAVIIDNTSSQTVANAYPQMLADGISIVTPNKKAFSGSWRLWQDIQDAAANSDARLYHESSVGAGLPVISTLKELVQTGDDVVKIEGVFSGTMSFLFNSFAPTEGSGGKWSAEVKRAKELGYTEPDPRDDLNGLDVARKLTILGRLVGMKIESPTSFPVQSLIPKELESVASGEEFVQKLPDFDHQMEDIKLAAEKEDKVVRFIGSIEVATNKIKVGLERFDRSHPIAAMKGSGNMIIFTTRRYPDPMIIQGAGAGGEVTAAGVTGDLIKVLDRVVRG